VHGIKCWDSNKIVDLDLEQLPKHPMYNIISLSTGHFMLNPNAEHIIVAIVGIFQKETKKKSEKKEDIVYTKMINFYENKNFGTDKDLSADVGSLFKNFINLINLNHTIKENIVPYRKVENHLWLTYFFNFQVQIVPEITDVEIELFYTFVKSRMLPNCSQNDK